MLSGKMSRNMLRYRLISFKLDYRYNTKLINYCHIVCECVISPQCNNNNNFIHKNYSFSYTNYYYDTLHITLHPYYDVIEDVYTVQH